MSHFSELPSLRGLCVHAQSCSRVCLFATPWTVAHRALLSMEFSRQEYWSGLPFPPPGDLPDPGIEPTSLALQVFFFFFTTEPTGKPRGGILLFKKLMFQLSVILGKSEALHGLGEGAPSSFLGPGL